jgi:hypothetical protein
MKPDNHTKQTRKLAGFYLYVATLIFHNIQHRATLAQISEKYDANTAFSWLQWSDAKQWFTSSAGGVYYLKPHLLNSSLSEVYKSIKAYYRL